MDLVTPAGCELMLIYRQTVTNPGARVTFLDACRDLELTLSEQKFSLLVPLWLYGPSVGDESQLTYVLGLSSIASHSPWIKSPAWKQFLKATRPLCDGFPAVTTVGDVAGVIVRAGRQSA